MSGRRDPVRYASDHWKALQKIDVLDRSGGMCEFERAFYGLPLGETHVNGQRIIEWLITDEAYPEETVTKAWARCGARAEGPGSGLAHIHRRHKLGTNETDDGIPLVLHPLVVLAACGNCHRNFDGRQHRGDVRAPAEALKKASMLVDHVLANAAKKSKAVVRVGLTNV